MTKRKLTLAATPIAATLALMAASPAWADTKAGVDAWERGNYDAAVREWRGLADRGDADAQFNLAQAYKLGRGVKADLAKAEELFGQAAAKGHLQAADNFGVLLFQRGERARAMPYIADAASRGDPRAQYLLGLAHFNGDNVEKDWVRGYALVSLARQAGLPQATPALAQMDKYIPLDQRQQSVPLAAQLASEAVATRERQIASADLGGDVRPASTATPVSHAPEIVSAENAVAAAARAAGTDSPRTAGADYLRPKAPAAAAPTPRVVAMRPAAPASMPASRPVPVAATAPKPAAPKPPAAATGSWRVQLGAFGVPGNADALWNRVKNRPELAGRAKLTVPAGRLTKLQAGGFASESEASSACSRLSAGGFTCVVARN